MSKCTPQQAEAVNGRGNLLVVAGAGTGKTHTLIARCLRLIVHDHVPLESILMVTFTEAAAAEMRGRLRQELLKLHHAQSGDEWLAQQLALLDTARISTLHGFCLQLAREHFHVLGLDPQFGILDESQTRPLQREVLDELLERHYAGTSPESLAVKSLIRAVGRGTDQRVRKLILKLHAHAQSMPDPKAWLREQRIGFESSQPDEWRVLFRRSVAMLRDKWLPDVKLVTAQTPALRMATNILERLPAEPSFPEAAQTTRDLAAADRSENWPRGTKGKFRDPLASFFDDVEFLASLAPDGSGTDPLAQDWGWTHEQMTALVNLVGEFTEAFDKKKRDLSGLDFTDLEQCALRLLRDDTVAAEWRARLAHIFVDEYQDINAAQNAILTLLSRKDADANRFLVGDVKQSIYRFRLANPRIFQRYQELWSKPTGATTEPNRAVALTENFRSRQALIDFVNPLFAALMRHDIGGVDHEPLTFGLAAERPDLAVKPGMESPVELHLIAKVDESARVEEEDDDTDSSANAPAPDLLAVEREARLVARRLRALKAGGEQVWDKERKCFRPVKWSDMAVLLRSPSGRAEAFAMEFNRAGVPLCAARDGFFTSLEVSDLLNLLKLLDNPLQDVPLLAVLRSPLMGMTLEELAEVRAQGGTKNLFWTALVRSVKSAAGALPRETRCKIELFLEQFGRWRELVRQTSLSQCLETALTETHYEPLLLAEARGPERVANVRRFLELARQFDPFQRQGLYRFLRFVRLQEEEELDLEPASPPTGDTVRLLSIHKSKGLEFPVVVLAGLGTRFNEQNLNEMVLLDESLGLCPKICPPDADQSYAGLTHWLARRHEQRELHGEELRLFYVALTRARDRLILVGTTNHNAGVVHWGTNPSEQIPTAEVESARCPLDWLLAWLPRVTRPEHWREEWAGGNDLLCWQIRDAEDPIFTNEVTSVPANQTKPLSPRPAKALEELSQRLAEPYPFTAATTEAAKTSVTVLRRQAADEQDDEATKLFQPKLHPQRTGSAKLSAADIGLAHHSFLQWVSLTRTGSKEELCAEAGRLQSEGLLTPDQSAALDFKSLAMFWAGEIGVKIRRHSANVKRELPFTARFGKAELDRLLQTAAITGNSTNDTAGQDFIVVQGVADLVVLLANEIWLVDFKTDQAGEAELPAKTKLYEPQLRIYATALARIYQKPVTQCWLYFLTVHKTYTVPLPLLDRSACV
jgi:ATP-dependent helicase/nuclease subunit A